MTNEQASIVKSLIYLVIVIIVVGSGFAAWESYQKSSHSVEMKLIESEKIKLKKEVEEFELLKAADLSKVLHDTVYINHQILSQNESTNFNNDIPRIVSLPIDSTILQLEATISKGDSIRAGHLNLVNPR